jgi:hypothetical protein
VKLVAAAIVLAGAMISAALYFALRPAVPAAPVAPAVIGAPLKSAAETLASYQPGLRIACWPTDAGERHPSRWIIDVTFDERGAQIARGFREERDASNPDVTKCVDRYLPALRIPAPGKTVQVEVPFALP